MTTEHKAKQQERLESVAHLAGKYLTFRLAGEAYGLEILKVSTKRASPVSKVFSSVSKVAFNTSRLGKNSLKPQRALFLLIHRRYGLSDTLR